MPVVIRAQRVVAAHWIVDWMNDSKTQCGLGMRICVPSRLMKALPCPWLFCLLAPHLLQPSPYNIARAKRSPLNQGRNSSDSFWRPRAKMQFHRNGTTERTIFMVCRALATDCCCWEPAGRPSCSAAPWIPWGLAAFTEVNVCSGSAAECKVPGRYTLLVHFMANSHSTQERAILQKQMEQGAI